ncbi:hypothetical protein M8J76_009819 [Diaphorina citri]|nr:hypothetical protein M8J76_009819 [Diaphorina citri]
MEDNMVDALQSRQQYDAGIAGSLTLPHILNLEDYVTGHIEEINALTNAIENPTKTKLAFQRLPKHMRRRVMSHNVKRMPRRLREAHAKYLAKQNLKCPHRPTRKYRRRPSNLLAEYNRRQRRHVWLETHIWHAKRFAMRPVWGYKLPERPNEKSYRACVRALDRYCILQDISYLACIELVGPEVRLLQGLSQHTDRSTGLSPGAKCHLSGAKEGHVMFYERNRHPYGAIGKVRVLWKPLPREEETSGDSSTRHLWLWCHPGHYEVVLCQLAETFHMNRDTPDIERTSPPSPIPDNPRRERAKKSVEREKLALKNIPFERKVPVYVSAQGEVRMYVLKDALNRFELRGPLSGAVLARAFKLYEEEGEGSSSQAADARIPISLRATSVQEDTDPRPHLWALLQRCSPSQFPPRSVIGATIRDPRFNMPVQRTRRELDPGEDEDLVELASLPSGLAESPLWCPAVRDWASTSKLSTAEIQRLFSSRLVPGVPQPHEQHHASPLPILVIQQEGTRHCHKKLGFGSGWDIVFPAGWSMPLLLALVFNGARVGGLREALNLSVQMRTEPALSVDSRAWRELEARRTNEARDNYFRKPSKKRPNFNRLGIASPFTFPWDVLLNDWASNPDPRETTRTKINQEPMDVDGETIDATRLDHQTIDPAKREHKTINTPKSGHQTIDAAKLDHQTIDASKLDHQTIDASKWDHQEFEQEQQCGEVESEANHHYYTLRDRQMIGKLNNFIQNVKGDSDDKCKNSPKSKSDSRHRQHFKSANKNSPHFKSESKNSQPFKSDNKRQNKNHTKTNTSQPVPTSDRADFDDLEADLQKVVRDPHRCLVQVNLRMIKRGTMDKYANICLPTTTDVDTLTYGGLPNSNNRCTRTDKSNVSARTTEGSTGKAPSAKVRAGKKYKPNRSQGDTGPKVTESTSESKERDEEMEEMVCTKTGSGQWETQGESEYNPKAKGHSQSQHLVGVETLRQAKYNPKAQEYSKYRSSGVETLSRGEIREPLHRDTARRARKALTRAHRALLARLKRRRARAKRRATEFEAAKRVKRAGAPTRDLTETYAHIMRQLWVPEVRLPGLKESEGSTSNESKETVNYLKQVSRMIETPSENHDPELTANVSEPFRDYAKIHDSSSGGTNQAGFARSSKRARKCSDDPTERRVKARMDTNEAEKSRSQLDENSTGENVDIQDCDRKPAEIPISKHTSSKDTATKDDRNCDTEQKNSSSRDVTALLTSRLRPITSLRFHTSRELMGFVTSESFHATAQLGQGCVTFNGLMDLLRNAVQGRVKPLVLV